MGDECYGPAPVHSYVELQRRTKVPSVAFDAAAQWESQSSSTSVKLIQYCKYCKKQALRVFPLFSLRFS